MLKLQSFFVLKFNSSRLKDYGYKIKINLSEARANNELVRVGDSNLFEELRRLKKLDENLEVEELRKAELEIRKIKKSKHANRSINKLESLQYVIDKYLFIPEIVNVVFSDNRHYKKIIEKGLFINGNRFVRLLSGAGNARRQTVLFVDERYYDDLNYFLDCGRNEEYQMNPNKYNAYFALSASSGHKVSIPSFVVIPDLEVTRPTKVDFISESPIPNTDPIVEEKVIDQTFNLFDGQGLMTPSYANQIGFDLDLDYTPASAIFRGAWMKGLLVTFDFKEYARQNNIAEIVDIYGSPVQVEDIDVILTNSQFKMSGAYESLSQYRNEVEKRKYGWRITRPSPKKDKNVSKTNYQYLQTLTLSKEQIASLCYDTVTYLKEVSGLNWVSSMIFLAGSLKKEDITKEWFERLDSVIKSLFYDPSLIQDKYIQNKLRKMISKKIRESYMGVLRVDGNYQLTISDPVAFVQHAFGKEVTGLLSAREFYSDYWNNLNINKVSALRSPLTWKSEVNILDLKNTDEMEHWYKYLNTGIIYNVFDNSVMLHSSMDFDGDLVMTTSSKEIMDGSEAGLPVTYERKSAPKTRIDAGKLWEADVRTFGGKIGFLTNLGTTFYSLIGKYSKSDPEYKILEDRLKSSCGFQNMQIDFGKGLEVVAIPEYWSKWLRWNDETSKEDRDKINLYNSLLAEKRPYFMRWVYPHYNRDYKKYLETYNTYSIGKFGISFSDLLKKENKTEDEENCVYYYNRHNNLLDTPSTMNIMSHHMEDGVRELQNIVNNTVWKYDVDSDKLLKMKKLYKQWKDLRKKYKGEETEILSSEIRRQSNNISIKNKEVAKLALMASAGFAFTVFSEALEDLFYKYQVQIPVLEASGDLLFDGEKYSLITLDLEDKIE